VCAGKWVRIWPLNYFIYYSIKSCEPDTFIVYWCIIYSEKTSSLDVIVCLLFTKVYVFKPFAAYIKCNNYFIFSLSFGGAHKYTLYFSLPFTIVATYSIPCLYFLLLLYFFNVAATEK